MIYISECSVCSVPHHQTLDLGILLSHTRQLQLRSLPQLSQLLLRNSDSGLRQLQHTSRRTFAVNLQVHFHAKTKMHSFLQDLLVLSVVPGGEKARFAGNLFNKQYSCNNFFYNMYSGWGLVVIYTNFAEIVTRKLRVMVQIANIMQLFLLKHDTQFIICAFLFKS